MFRDSPKISIEDENTPSNSYAAIVHMEDLLEKLKLLNYENEFINELKMKYISRHYFAVPVNPGEQFHMFTCLAAWLIRKSGKNCDQPQEYDDPNSTISVILEFLREINVPIEFPPNKLKQGAGEQAVYVLDNLANHAIKSVNFKWEKPNILPEESMPEPEIEDDDPELILEKVEEEMMAEYDEEDDEVIHVSDITKLFKDNSNNFTVQDHGILKSKIDSEEWKLELERIIPQLKVTVKTDSRDWRAHLDQMKQLRNSMTDNLSGITGQLEKLNVTVGNTLDKISSREAYLNKVLESHLDELRILQEELSGVKEGYRNVSGAVTERTRVLNKYIEELDQVKREMDERGSSMTDGTPLINVKKIMAKMKSEISEMSVRIGVLEYSLICSGIRDKTQMQEDMNTNSTFSI